MKLIEMTTNFADMTLSKEWEQNHLDMQVDNNDTQQTTFDETFLIAYFTFLLFIVTLALSGNLMFILVTVFSPQLHNVTSFIVAHLASVDLILLFVITCDTINWILNSLDKVLLIWCNVIGTMLTLCYSLKTWNLMILCIDQHIWINKPLKYHQMVTKQRIIKIISTLWILNILIVSLPLLTGNNYTFHKDTLSCLPHPKKGIQTINFIYSIFIPIVISSGFYIQVVKSTWKQANRRVIICNKINCSYVRRTKTDKDIIKCLVLTGGVYILCWIPGLFTSMLALISVHISPYIRPVSQTIMCLSMAIVPIVQYIYNTKFQKAAKQLWHRLFAMHSCRPRNRIRDLKLEEQRQYTENEVCKTRCEQVASKPSSTQQLVGDTTLNI
ncbi:alpha-1A adrenergic receptor-like [Anneissia japonica]|uniref:alpha-1A adrenergic receptor-like n=1 Tax=Anneissia japonica TaxID=1529436 RepID=UPI0014258E11|nr:alpha-1A adrenergic receptor-like [Anneissia japonica]XP_033101137.1 alpha-1A adrenergic receptor-like [Anneissia japonica]